MDENVTQRVGPLVELPSILREMNVDVGEVFAGSGFAPDQISQDTRMKFGTLLPLLERAAVLSGCPYIGLLVGLRFELVAHHGPIGALMETAPTLKDALTDCVAWQLGYSTGAIVFLNRSGDEYELGYSTYAAWSPGTKVLYDIIVGIAVRTLGELTDGAEKPVEVFLSHRETETWPTYRKLLKVPVRFDQTRNGIVIEGRAMKTTPPKANSELRKQRLAQLPEQLWERPPNTIEQVEHLLRHALHYGRPTLAEISSLMGLHPRTLRRRLAEDGQTFEQARDRVRFMVAREMLELTELPIGEIGAMLSFASPGVFSEAFARWSGMSPSAWRKQVTPGNIAKRQA